MQALRRLRIVLACALTMFAAACRTAEPTPRARPNLVVFLVDDLGWQDTSLALGPQRTPFNERYHTPNVERLAREGTSFRQAYAAAPVCTPTRTSMLTGRAPARTHITYWTLRAGRDTSAKFEGLAPPKWSVDGLQPEDDVLPARLAREGYRTIHVGKAHFGALGTPGADPRALGFDVNVAGHAAGAPASYYGADSFASTRPNTDEVWNVPGLERWHGQDVYLTEALTAEALEQVRAAHAAGQPFYLNFATYAVHAPIQANRRYLARYADLDPTEAAYATMVESYDAALGAVLDELEKLGVANDTLVWFASDNGGLSAHARGGDKHTHNAPLRSGKGSAYEGGVRIPMVVRWPGVARAGAMSDAVVSTTDIYATLLAAAGAEPSPLALDSLDLREVLRGGEALDERVIVWNQPHFWGVSGPGIWPYSAIRSGRWKLVYRHLDRGFELYDLVDDLSEAHDLASKQPTRVAELARELSNRLRAMDAQLSIDARTGEPVEWPDEALSER